MLKINDTVKPKDEILAALAVFQKEIDDLPTFEEKRKQAKKLFSSRNKKGNKVFDAIKAALITISPGIARCAYCEDSHADEVEHIYPKDLYPQFCFLWINYLYACGICNGGKNNKFAIFRHDNGQYQIVSPKNPKTQAVEPPAGDMVLINLHLDDPFDFCRLDLETFLFAITAPAHTKAFIRADYTFNTVLKLA